jgi:hypothetical protein
VGKPDGKSPLGRHSCRWEDNIKMDLIYRMGLYGLDSSSSGYELVEECCEHGNEPSGSTKYCQVLEWLSD